MAWALDDFEASDGRVQIRTFGLADCERVAPALFDPTGWYAKKLRIDSEAKVLEWLRGLADGHSKGVGNPLLFTVGDEVAGVTRLHRLKPEEQTLEIGTTWVASRWKRTFVNTSVKSILLRHAFETLDARRVEFRVNSANYASQLNVLRLGAKLDGNLRGSLRYPGQGVSDVNLYSVIKSEWPEVRDRLQALVDRREPKPGLFPPGIETARLTLKPYQLCDADEILDLLARNRSHLAPSFPLTSGFQNANQVHAFIAEKAHLASQGAAFFYAVRDRRSNALVGQLQIKHLDWRARSADLGYYIDSARWREGLATELLSGALECLKGMRFNRLTARVLPENKASLELLKRLGFELEGVQRSAFVTGHGEVSDIVLMARAPLTG